MLARAYLQRDKIVFVCAAGSRSKLAAAHGLKEVYNLSGGTNGWRAAGLQLSTCRSDKPPSERTRRHQLQDAQ